MHRFGDVIIVIVAVASRFEYEKKVNAQTWKLKLSLSLFIYISAYCWRGPHKIIKRRRPYFWGYIAQTAQRRIPLFGCKWVWFLNRSCSYYFREWNPFFAMIMCVCFANFVVIGFPVNSLQFVYAQLSVISNNDQQMAEVEYFHSRSFTRWLRQSEKGFVLFGCQI